MSDSPSSREAAVRLGEQAKRNTRARFEQWAQNPACQANTISAVHNIHMADVATREGFKPTFGQSPFALARGNTFERQLLRNGAARLLEALIDNDVLPASAVGLEDLRIRMNGGPLKDLESAIAATSDLVLRIAEAKSDASLDALAAADAVPDLHGVDVYVVGAGVMSSSELPATRILAIQAFWQGFFTAAGADLPTDRYGAALVRFP
jgi:hypothetical protein